MEKLRVAMIGLGMAAGHHARSLLDLSDKVEVAAVYSRNVARRLAFSEKFGFPAANEPDAIFADRSIEAVLILTPPDTHLDLVQKAAASGKHILLEKPLDTSLQRAEKIVALANEAGIMLSVALQNRFRPAVIALEALLASGRFGDIIEASASIRNWRPQSYYDEPGRGTKARDGGGVLLTQAIHTIDLLLNFAGQPQNVAAFARTSPVHSMETEDQVCAAFSFPNGAIGTLNATTCAWPGFPERIELIGTQGTAVLTGSQLEARLKDGTVIVESGGATGSGTGADPMAFGHELHRALLLDFVTAIRSNGQLKVTGADALNAQQFVDAALVAARF
jgi:predicted dehydrogenase